MENKKLVKFGLVMVLLVCLSAVVSAEVYYKCELGPFVKHSDHGYYMVFGYDNFDFSGSPVSIEDIHFYSSKTWWAYNSAGCASGSIEIGGEIYGAGNLCTEAIFDDRCAGPEDLDEDGYNEYVDCDDLNAAVNPGMTEVCNYIDDDCDGVVDEDCEIVCDVDLDCGEPACAGELNYCDGGNIFQEFEYPVCENAGSYDSYCSVEYGPELILECGFGCFSGRCLDEPEVDEDDDGYVVDDDCDDLNAEVNPGADELCNYIDDDCDGVVDEDCEIVCDVDLDCGEVVSTNVCSGGDVYRDYSEPVCGNAGEYGSYCSVDTHQELVQDCSYGCFSGECIFKVDEDLDDDGFDFDVDCDDSDASVYPGALEICGNGVDEDCSGFDLECVDDDEDDDGYVVGEDCDDLNAAVHPGAVEICGNGVDEDCDGFDLVCGNETDIEAPGAVGDLSADVGLDWIFWSWVNPVDLDFAFSLVYVDGVNVVNSSLTDYNLSGLGSGESHTIEIFTADSSGNVNWDGVFDEASTLSEKAKKKSSHGHDDGVVEVVNYYAGEDSVVRDVVVDASGAIELSGSSSVDEGGWGVWVWLLVIGILGLLVLIVLFLVFG